MVGVDVVVIVLVASDDSKSGRHAVQFCPRRARPLHDKEINPDSRELNPLV